MVKSNTTEVLCCQYFRSYEENVVKSNTTEVLWCQYFRSYEENVVKRNTTEVLWYSADLNEWGCHKRKGEVSNEGWPGWAGQQWKGEV